MELCLIVHHPSVSRSTKQTPFFLAFSRKPTLLIEREYPVEAQAEEVNQTAVGRHMEAALSLFNHQKTAYENIKSSQEAVIGYFNKKRAAPEHRVKRSRRME